MARNKDRDLRIYLFIVIIFLTVLGVSYRLFNITFLQHEKYASIAQVQQSNPSARLAGRGNIYFSDISDNAKKLAVTNQTEYYAYQTAQLATSLDEVATRMSLVLNKDASVIKTALEGHPKSYYIIEDNISKDQAQKITDLHIKGLAVASKIERYYANNTLASNVLGFVGYQGNTRVGQYGIEGYYDSTLSGNSSTKNIWGNKTYTYIVSTIKNVFSASGSSSDKGSTTTVTGNDLVLTIDKNIQEIAEQKLGEAIKRWQAASGTVIIQDPSTGAILAMASSPSFDPAHYSDSEIGNYTNPNVQSIYEPGSSFKSITMAASLDKKVLNPETTYTDTGEIKLNGYPIHNYDNKAHGLQTMRQVLEKSLNTGVIFAENLLGDDNFINYVVGFGFGQKTGIDLVGEVSGDISNLYSGRKINFATASFGQGVAATPLQLINAYSAIANGGKLFRPYVVKSVVHPDGSETTTKPEVIGTPLQSKAADQLKSMLVGVVENGFDKARVPGYYVAGKTGTAQIPDGHGGYIGNNEFIHNFVGFAPAYDPKFVILLKIERPKGVEFASNSLPPYFADITRFLLHYFNIPPTR